MELKLKAGDSKKYKVKAIWNNAVYARKLESDQLSSLYYLVAWKKYPKDKNIWKPSFAVQHLKKLINSFYKNHLKKLTIISLPINSALSMARPTIRPNLTFKRKRGQLAGSANKRAKNWVFRCLWHLNNFLIKTSVLANNKMELAWVKLPFNFLPSQIDGGALLLLLIVSIFLLILSY